MTSVFDDLLTQAKKSKQPELIAKPEPKIVPKNQEWAAKLQMLPSEIPAPKSTTITKKQDNTSNRAIQTNGSSKRSFRDLLKLAASNEAEGLLVRKVSTDQQDPKIMRLLKPESKKAIPESSPKMGSSAKSTRPILSKSLSSSDLKVRKVPPSTFMSKTKISDPKKGINPKFIKLNTQKRDLTSMEDILQEIKARKAEKATKELPSANANPKTLSRPSVSYKASKSTNTAPTAVMKSTLVAPAAHIKPQSIAPKKPKYVVSGANHHSTHYEEEDDYYSSGSEDMEAGYFDLEQEERKR